MQLGDKKLLVQRASIGKKDMSVMGPGGTMSIMPEPVVQIQVIKPKS
jgi:hypothetical protein